MAQQAKTQRAKQAPRQAAKPQTAARGGRPQAARGAAKQAAKAQETAAPAPFAFPHFRGALPAETAPLILETRPSADYALLDTGFGRKLELYGARRIIRPEGQALCPPLLPEAEWAKADAVFSGNLEEEGVGRWHFPQREKQGFAPPQAALSETWPLRWRGLPYLGRFTSFRHVGVFPEQTAHWLFIEQLIKQAKARGRQARLLNLFGYTGLASLIAARAGAEVSHIDASKKAIGWARENQSFAAMESAPIRWICEDALKFMRREARRGKHYDIILLDPPAYGRGPKGEVWQFFSNIAELAALARALLSPQPLAVVLTAYSIRASFYALHALLREAFRGKGGKVESGELIIRQGFPAEAEQNTAPRQNAAPHNAAGRALSTSLFSRWVSDNA